MGRNEDLSIDCSTFSHFTYVQFLYNNNNGIYTFPVLAISIVEEVLSVFQSLNSPSEEES